MCIRQEIKRYNQHLFRMKGPRQEELEVEELSLLIKCLNICLADLQVDLLALHGTTVDIFSLSAFIHSLGLKMRNLLLPHMVLHLDLIPFSFEHG